MIQKQKIVMRFISKKLIRYKPTILIEILNEEEPNTNTRKIHTLLNDLNYSKYFIDDNGNLSKSEINSNRFNYIFTTKTFANIV